MSPMKYLVTSVAVAVACALSGCATSKTIIGQDGKPLHKISCDGTDLTIDACYEKAGELCGSAGYDILGQDGSARNQVFATMTTFAVVPVVTRTVMARCREARGITTYQRSFTGY